jgi:hypothetical protein
MRAAKKIAAALAISMLLTAGQWMGRIPALNITGNLAYAQDVKATDEKAADKKTGGDNNGGLKLSDTARRALDGLKKTAKGVPERLKRGARNAKRKLTTSEKDGNNNKN